MGVYRAGCSPGLRSTQGNCQAKNGTGAAKVMEKCADGVIWWSSEGSNLRGLRVSVCKKEY